VAGPPVFGNGDVSVYLDLRVCVEFIRQCVKLGLGGDFYDVHDILSHVRTSRQHLSWNITRSRLNNSSFPKGLTVITSHTPLMVLNLSPLRIASLAFFAAMRSRLIVALSAPTEYLKASHASLSFCADKSADFNFSTGFIIASLN
jgi:hypothetical protein